MRIRSHKEEKSLARALFRDEKGSALIESYVVLPIIVLMMMIMVQFSLLVAVHLTANFAAYRAARAVYVSSNKSRDGYDGRSSSRHTAVSDARNAVMRVMIPLQMRGWVWFYGTELYYNQAGSKSRMSEEPVQSDQTLLPDRDIWVKVTVRANIVVPLTKYIFSDGAPFIPLPWKTIHTYYIVHTPSRGDSD